MSLHERYRLTRVINARGTFTPLGVSRSSPQVAESVGRALQDFFVIDELQSVLSQAMAHWTGAESGTAVHCTSAAITLSVAAAMTGSDGARIAALPLAQGMPSRIVLPATHAVDYGHPLATDVRLAGATPVFAGSDAACSIAQLDAALGHDATAGLLLVSSRLVRGEPLDLRAAVAAAHRRGVPAIIDGAAQDLRIGELLSTGADLVLVSAQKYLAGPTAGLVIGRRQLVQAVRAQERGIGRAMKATKEAMVGVLTALQERRQLDLKAWADKQRQKVNSFVKQAAQGLRGLQATATPDPSGMPFGRVCLTVEPAGDDWNAGVLAARLQAGSPPVWVMDHAARQGKLYLELVPLDESEIRLIVERITELAPGRQLDLADREKESSMCRNIRTLFNFEPPATEQEIRAASLQFVRKLSGFNVPSRANAAAFERAVDEVAAAASRLLDSMVTAADPRDREIEAVKAKERAAVRFGP